MTGSLQEVFAMSRITAALVTVEGFSQGAEPPEIYKVHGKAFNTQADDDLSI